MRPSEVDLDGAIQEGAHVVGTIPEQWVVQFTNVHHSGVWIKGHLLHHQASRWMTVPDMENDILAGDYLENGVRITVSSRLRIDIYDVVVDQCMHTVHDEVETMDLIDLTMKSGDDKPDPRIGGRFWFLADSNEDEENVVKQVVRDNHKEPTTTMVAKPVEAVPSLVHRWIQKKPMSPVKPWIGLIPKVTRSPITLLDFVPDSWTIVTKKKKGKKERSLAPPPPVSWAANEIQAARQVCLNLLLG